MRRKFKAFTLIELLVVIVIFGIIMAALMNFFKPIRQTYVDSTLYDQQRTTQNGIIEYLCESTRYAEKMIIYDQGSNLKNNDGSRTITNINSVNDALNDFYTAYDFAGTYTGSDLTDAQRRVRVIVINRGTVYDKNGKYQGSFGGSSSAANGFTGRLITNIDDNTVDGSKHYIVDDVFTDEEGQRTKSSTGVTYMALGGAFYGDCDYSIYVDKDKTFPSGNYSGGITFGVVSSMRNTGNVVSSGKISGSNQLQVGDDYVTLKTLEGNITKNLGNVDYFYNRASLPNGSTSETGVVTNAHSNTYIVFMIPDENDR